MSLSKQSTGPQNNQETNFDDLKDNYNCKYIPCEDYRQKIKDCLNSNEMRNELENLRSKITNDNISQADTIALLRNICVKLSDNSLRKIKFANSNNSYKGKAFKNGMTKIANRQKKKLINTVNYIKKPLETNFVKLKQNCESSIFLKLSTLLIRSREKRRECIGKGKGKL